MFELIKYEILKELDRYFIKIFIKNLTDNIIKSEIILTDIIFQQCTRKQIINFSPKTTHWVSWDLTQNNIPNEEKGLQMHSLWGCNLKLFVDEKIIQEFPLKYTFTNLNLREGLNNFSPFNKKKFWIVGDSHSSYYTNSSPEYLTTSKYDIIPLSIMSLTLNKFLKSDWEKWFNTLPIFDDDIVAFDIGEIDLRCGIFLSSTKKNIDVDILTNELLEKYFKFLIYFKEKFKNKILLLTPNRPIKDGYVTGNSEYFKLTISTTNERLELWNNFNNKLKLFCEDKSIKYWDIKHMYKDIDGTLFNNILYKNDIHIKIKEPMLFDLKYKIENFL
jgi:hypothetical protein